MLGHIFPFLFVVSNYTSSYPLLTSYPNRFIDVRIVCHFGDFKPLNLVCLNFPIIFDFDGGQEVTPIFVIQGTIVHFIILQLILHG